MNDLQSFTDEAAVQTRPVNQETFRFVGDVTNTLYYGTFGDPQIIPVMTRQGYQDHLVTPMSARAVQDSPWPNNTPPVAHSKIIRISNGRELFVQVVNYTGVVLFKFILTDRQL